MLLLFLGVTLTACGIQELNSRSTNYNAPIYISREFTLTHNSTYTISGQSKTAGGYHWKYVSDK